MMPAATLVSYISKSSDETFRLGEEVGRGLRGGELILLSGDLGAGKTIFAKGIMSALDYDPDEVTSPSFTLVNLYNARLDVYHIDLWRLDEATDATIAVGLDDILANDTAVVIVEWADRLRRDDFAAETIRISISGDGDEPRTILIESKDPAVQVKS